jgi:hypothetical protein
LRRLIVAGGLAAAAAGIIVLGLVATREREEVRRATCRKMLRSLGHACHMYADDAYGEFPSTWPHLHPTYVDNAKFFSCPSCPSTYEDFYHGNVTELSSSYVLVPGLRSDMPGILILIYEKPGNHGGSGFHVVRSCAEVEWWPAGREAELRRFIELQAEALAKWRGSGKAPMGINDFVGPEFDALMMGRAAPQPTPPAPR